MAVLSIHVCPRMSQHIIRHIPIIQIAGGGGGGVPDLWSVTVIRWWFVLFFVCLFVFVYFFKFRQ